MMTDLSISIVLYENDAAEIQNLLNCIYATRLSYKVYLIDNSATDKLKTLGEGNHVTYSFNNKNIGFGKAHNIALRQSVNDSLYHLVLNPDVEFGAGVLERIFQFMEQHKDTGLLLPKVFYKNGELQKLCNLLPQPMNLISRRFFKNAGWAGKLNDQYELKGFDYNTSMNIPNLSGCFMYLRCSVLQQTGLFDERYFMYMEDVDLSRRIHAVSKTVFYPGVKIVHGFEKESYSNKAVLKYHVQSAIKYFNKWGWYFDAERKKINQIILNAVKLEFQAKRNDKPKILMLINRFVVGGIANDVIPLAYYLQNDFDILILYGEKEKDEAEAVFLLKAYPGLQLKKIPSFKKSINPINDHFAYNAIKKEIKNFKADIVHTHGPKSGFLGRLAAYRCKVPCVVHTFHGHHFHSYYNRAINSGLLKIEKMLARITTTIIAVSSFQEKELSEIYKIIPAGKIKTIPLGVEAGRIINDAVCRRNDFRQKYSVSEDTVAIGIAGRMVPIKNLGMFVQAAYKLKEKVKRPVRFFMMGDGILKKQVEKECDENHLSYTEKTGAIADVVFTSWVEDIIPAMHAMDIVILTSDNEGTPMSLIEAQWCGKPVVATNVGGVRDTLIDGQTGFLIEANDIDGMVSKLQLLSEDDSLRKDMGKKASQFAEAVFSKETEVENYKLLYKNMITPKNMERLKYRDVSFE